MAINPKIFKKYDIRGKASGEGAVITPEVARQIGRAFATYLQPLEQKNLVVVGRDNRTSSYDLQHALMQGISEAGCGVIDLGLVATPLVYWHAVNQGDCGGVMVTGSHLAPDQNGFKLCIGSRALYGDQIQALLAIIQINEYFYGQREIITNNAAYSDYVRDLTDRIPPTPRLKVVIDAGNGTGGLFAPKLFTAWGHNVLECLYCEPDGTYPNHHPNPQEEDNMRDLGRRVVELEADLGIAFDGDADRMGAVDEKGQMITADRLLALMAVDMLKRHPGAAVVADVLTSQVLFDAVEEVGGQAFMAPSGHSLVKEMMREKNALLAGEMSGHIFLGEDYFSFDDGFMAAGRLLQLVASSDKTLSELDADLPRLYSTPEYRPHCPDDDKETVINGVAAALAGKGEAETIDGLRIKFENGWGLLRASNTEPVLSMRFEAKTEADALAYRDLFFEALKAYPQVALG
ncbi:MAG: phosphomannomutase/phosphoglucomutase [Anaerolineae bacterium]